MVTNARNRFTVLVEIKKPNTALLEDAAYRNGAYAFSAELAGAVSQVQTNARTWENQGAKEPDMADQLAEVGAHTVRPKSILIVGNTSQLNSRAKRESFELFRNNLHTPEIITFDELLERSKHLLLNDQNQLSNDEEDDDIPF